MIISKLVLYKTKPMIYTVILPGDDNILEVNIIIRFLTKILKKVAEHCLKGILTCQPFLVSNCSSKE